MNELLERWLASIDLHLQYVELSDEAYARAQAWPAHERPTRWVLEVARQKLLELQTQCETRQAMGDGRFAEALELMAFLANLVGLQHIERFIPLATAPSDSTAAEPSASPSPGASTSPGASGASPSPGASTSSGASGASLSPGASGRSPSSVPSPSSAATAPATAVAQPPSAHASRAAPAASQPDTPPRAAGDETTREMPRLRPAAAANSAAAPAHSAAAPANSAAAPANSAAARFTAAPTRTPPASKTAEIGAKAVPAAARTSGVDMKSRIIADAVRLLKWGKPWHELAELIARIADRPSASEIRKVLRANKADIEARSR